MAVAGVALEADGVGLVGQGARGGAAVGILGADRVGEEEVGGGGRGGVEAVDAGAELRVVAQADTGFVIAGGGIEDAGGVDGDRGRRYRGVEGWFRGTSRKKRPFWGAPQVELALVAAGRPPLQPLTAVQASKA